MKNTILSLARNAGRQFLALAVFTASAAAVAEETEEVISGSRGMVMEIQAEVIDVNLETRQVALKGPDGEMVYVAAQENVVSLEDVSPGDVLLVDYLVALEGEVREPTAEELAEPFAILEGAALDTSVDHPAAGAARVVRAVCTISAIDTESNSITVTGVQGNTLDIHDVEADKLAAIEVGQQIVLVYREALALSLEKVAPAE